MDYLSLEHKPGPDSPILMCEGDVNRGPLKNDVSISMLILGVSFSRNGTEHCCSPGCRRQRAGRGHPALPLPPRGQSPDTSWVDLPLENSVGSSLPLKVGMSPLAPPAYLPGAFKIKTPKRRKNFVSRAECGASSDQSVFQPDNSLPVTTGTWLLWLRVRCRGKWMTTAVSRSKQIRFTAGRKWLRTEGCIPPSLLPLSFQGGFFGNVLLVGCVPLPCRTWGLC